MPEICEIKEFSLGAGEIYVAPGTVSEGELYDDRRRAGYTDGGCILTYEYKTKELFDTEGNLSATLKFGEKLTVKGTLRRIAESALPVIITGDSHLGGRGRLSVLLVCPLPDGQMFKLYVRGGVPVGTVFNVKEGGGAEFSFTCGKGFENPEFTVKSVFPKEVSA